MIACGLSWVSPAKRARTDEAVGVGSPRGFQGHLPQELGAVKEEDVADGGGASAHSIVRLRQHCLLVVFAVESTLPVTWNALVCVEIGEMDVPV